MSKKSQNNDVNIQQVQSQDYDSYLSLIFTPKDKRKDCLSLVKFNLEIAHIKNRVTEEATGLIRYKWWEEAIEEVFDTSKPSRNHIVVNLLDELFQNNVDVKKDDFLTVISSREVDISKKPFASFQDFEEYLTNTSFPVSKIYSQILIGNKSREYSGILEKVSKAWAATAILRSAPKNFSDSRNVFPTDLCVRHNLKIDRYGSDEFLNNSQKIIQEIVMFSEQNILDAKKEIKNLKPSDARSLKPIFLKLSLAEGVIKQIKVNSYDIFSKPLNPYLGAFKLSKIYFGKF